MDKKTAEEKIAEEFNGENLRALVEKYGVEPESAYAAIRESMLKVDGGEERWNQTVEGLRDFIGCSFRVAELCCLGEYEEAFRVFRLETPMSPGAWLAALGAASRWAEDETAEIQEQ